MKVKRKNEYNVFDNVNQFIKNGNSLYAIDKINGVYITHDTNAIIFGKYPSYYSVVNNKILEHSVVVPKKLDICLKKGIEKRSIKIIKPPLFYFLFVWSMNYRHFLTDLLPKINSYFIIKKRQPGLKILISPKCSWHFQFLSLLGLGRKDFYFIDESGLKIRTLYTPSCYGDIMKLKYPDQAYKMLYRIQLKLSTLHRPRFRSRKRIFLSRDDKSRSNIGRARRIINKDRLVKGLAKRGIITVTVENKKVLEKYQILSGSELIISPIGSNLMNLSFSSGIKKVVIIGHPNLKTYDHYKKWITLNGRDKTEIIFFHDTVLIDKSDKNPNVPYKVKVPRFLQLLDKILR